MTPNTRRFLLVAGVVLALVVAVIAAVAGFTYDQADGFHPNAYALTALASLAAGMIGTSHL